jgi:transposase
MLRCLRVIFIPEGSVMGRGRDVGKERFWRDVIYRWQHSKQSVRAFCFEKGLSESSFHLWRRIISQRDQEAAGTRPAVETGEADLPAFVPLRVIPEPVAASVVAALEVVVGPGRLIRVPPGFDPATLRNVLAVLEEDRSC